MEKLYLVIFIKDLNVSVSVRCFSIHFFILLEFYFHFFFFVFQNIVIILVKQFELFGTFILYFIV